MRSDTTLDYPCEWALPHANQTQCQQRRGCRWEKSCKWEQPEGWNCGKYCVDQQRKVSVPKTTAPTTPAPTTPAPTPAPVYTNPLHSGSCRGWSCKKKEEGHICHDGTRGISFMCTKNTAGAPYWAPVPVGATSVGVKDQAGNQVWPTNQQRCTHYIYKPRASCPHHYCNVSGEKDEGNFFNIGTFCTEGRAYTCMPTGWGEMPAPSWCAAYDCIKAIYGPGKDSRILGWTNPY